MACEKSKYSRQAFNPRTAMFPATLPYCVGTFVLVAAVCVVSCARARP